MINIIVATSKNGVIGKDNQLIWNLPEDLKRFKQITTNNVIVMGRKTHESIGKSLPNRLNVILSNNTKWYKPLGDNCVVCYSIEEVLERFKHRDLYIIGGGQIYEKFLPYTSKILLTLIDKDFDGDTYFDFDRNDFNLISKETYTTTEFDYHFLEYDRINFQFCDNINPNG